MLAPIALYPDALLAQILMASTYPVEVVEADRWIRQHARLKGAPLDAALQRKEWDPSIKALCHFPTVLAEMDKNLSRTTQLGNAFLAQQAEVMDVVQELRRKARDMGTLESCPQEKVVVQGEAIAIEPVEPVMVYVPYYNPLVVFGTWWYPAYLPYVWFPSFYVSTGVVFSVGFTVGPAVIGWTAWNWPGHALVVDPAVAVPFIGVAAVAGVAAGSHSWTHDPTHRRGVAYADPATALRFGQAGTARTGMPRGVRGFTGPGQAGTVVTGSHGGARGLVGTSPSGRIHPGANPWGGTGRRGGPAVLPSFSPFSGLSRHGGGFEHQATQRGGMYHGMNPIGHGGGVGGAPVFHGGGGGGGGGHHH
jgi:hypothetical protein